MTHTHVLINSMVCTFSWSALCRSANINISAALSIDRLLHSASSHMTFSLSSAYCKRKKVLKRQKIRLKNNLIALMRKKTNLVGCR